MHTGLEEVKDHFDRLATFYAERAAGEVGLIVTGGFAPNEAGRVHIMGSKLTTSEEAKEHRRITDAVHHAGGAIALQILHTGRYGYHPGNVAPSAIKAPINPVVPKALSGDEIIQTIEDFGRCAALAREAGYDGVEIMGSEGYLLNEFIATATNRRDDEWGGPFENRIRLPLEVIRRVRERAGQDFIVIYRLSMLDLVEGGSTWDEVVRLGREVERAGADIINTGIGWHEARVPTIAMSVPRGAFTWVTARLEGEVTIPLVTTNRINTPEVAERILAQGQADMISMARPLLADSHFVAKARQGRADEINTCVGCNQACLDNIFTLQTVSCLVNPRAGHETELVYEPTSHPRKIAVVGGGPAGLACAEVAAERGHHVTLFESGARIGGQLNLTVKVPGKEEFLETIRYFETRLAALGAEVRLETRASVETLIEGGFDVVVVASGVLPRRLDLEGVDRPNVLGYLDVLRDDAPLGERVAIIGAGGIGFEVAELITHRGANSALDTEAFLQEWGIDAEMRTPGGLSSDGPKFTAATRQVYLCQRKKSKVGGDLGKTTGWIHRRRIRERGVAMLAGVNYRKIDDQGLHIEHDGQEKILEVDTVVVCAGQESLRELEAPLREAGVEVHLIGGATKATGLDAKRAIREGCELAAKL
jgi:2,4-dienoyl-CoA reductase (NADPH2)